MTKFSPGNAVVHKSNKKPRKMVVVAQCTKKIPPDNKFNEMVNCGVAQEGDYFCTWISGNKKGGDVFNEVELELQ